MFYSSCPACLPLTCLVWFDLISGKVVVLPTMLLITSSYLQNAEASHTSTSYL